MHKVKITPAQINNQQAEKTLESHNTISNSENDHRKKNLSTSCRHQHQFKPP